MPLDVFICGTCMTSFNDIEQFIVHKNDQCGKAVPSETSVQLQTLDNETSNAINSVTSLNQTLSEAEQQDINIEVIGENVASSTSLPGSESLLADSKDMFQGENQHTVIILQGDTPNLNIEGAEQILAEVIQEQKAAQTLTAETFKKRRGRGPGRNKKSDVKKPTFDPNEKNIPVKGEDGRLICSRCKKSFTKERVFNAHKCIALSEYVDFSTKEVVNMDPDDNHLPQDDLEDAGAMGMDDDDKEYKIPSNTLKKDESFDSDNSMKGVANPGEIQNGQVSDSNGKLGPVEVDANPDIEERRIMRETDQISNVPIFLNDAEKLAFEASLNVDISSVDQFFRIHCIEQELNQNISTQSRFTSNQLTLYSCNVCDKVFKSLSHMRFHGLTHTNLKPFKCIKCNYSSNARGNLYTHMRKHTGQFYCCNKCEFKTVNKSHLLEHEMTHSKVKRQCELCKKYYNTLKSLMSHIRKYHDNAKAFCEFKTVNKSHLLEHEMTHSKVKRQCELCKKYYNTLKSLMSHIRKYHDNAKGKEYLAKFMQGRDIKGSTVIHQCHVCNRKFKKKMDRDRHLFVHDIRDLPGTQRCDLCDYTASRPSYLEKHFQKHRCIYRCCKCMQMFLSSVKLVEHLTSHHIDVPDNKSNSWEGLFEASINTSLYLPEPDQMMQKEEKDLVNLPAELSQTGIDQMNRLKNSGEEGEDQIIDSDVFINKVPTTTEANEDKTMIESENPEITPDSNTANSADTEINENSVGNISQTESQDTMDSKLSNIKNEDKTIGEHGEDTEVTEEEEVSCGDPAGVEDADSGETSNDVEDTLRETTHDIDDADLGETTHVVEETDLTEEELLGGRSTSLRGTELIEKLGYLPMTLEIFQKMRDTFGTEECEFCGRLFFSRVDYEPHVRTHTGDKQHYCELCGYRAITKDGVKRHIERDHQNMTYPCRECNFVAHSRAQLWNHSMEHKGLKGVECPECQELFDSIKELKGHAVLMHPNSTQEELEKLTAFKHKAQGKLGRRSYKCPHCDKTFFRANSELQKHMWIHEGIKPFKCPLCPHACRSKNNLQAHMIRHSKDKPFMCGECGKAYKSKTALRWHVRSHADGKLFKCEKCPYEATQRSHLKRHMETHDVIKRFICQHCDFSANTIGSLKMHYTRFHKDIEFLPSMGSVPVEISQPNTNVFKCLSCDYLFGNLADLKRHLKIRHHVNVQELNQHAAQQGTCSEVQVLQIADDQPQAVSMEVMGNIGSETQVVTEESNLDEKTASAVNILQQIFDMSQNGTLSQQGETGSVLQLNPETIIVQQDGTNMFVSSDGDVDGNQYVIQYITPNEAGQSIDMVVQEEVSTEDMIVEPEVVNS